MVAHRNRAGFDAVDHFADATELRIREYLDLDASVGALLDQCSQFIGVPGLRCSGNADMRVTKLGLRLRRRRGMGDGQSKREKQCRWNDAYRHEYLPWFFGPAFCGDLSCR